MITRALLLACLALAISTAASGTPRAEPAAQGAVVVRSTPASRADSAPMPLGGVPLTGATGLRLLVANDPPYLLDVDSGRVRPITGLPPGGRPLSVRAVGEDAVVWRDSTLPGKHVPSGKIYVVPRGATGATGIATAWDVAASADGEAVWLKSYSDARHCTLREVSLDGVERRSPRPLSCSTRLIEAAGGALLAVGRSLVDAGSGRTVLRTGSGGFWAMAGRFALTVGGDGVRGPLILTDVRAGKHWRLRYPSRISGQGGRDQAVVQRNGTLLALSFSDPAYELSGTQVTDVWLLDPTTRRFRHLPDMPAAVHLKFTSMSWVSDGRLVLLAHTTQGAVVAVWRPGESRIAIRRVQLPAPNSGSDSFVVWGDADEKQTRGRFTPAAESR